MVFTSMFNSLVAVLPLSSDNVVRSTRQFSKHCHVSHPAPRTRNMKKHEHECSVELNSLESVLNMQRGSVVWETD
jgi:hypothetical protein